MRQKIRLSILIIVLGGLACLAGRSISAAGIVPAEAATEQRTILVDDFAPQPRQGYTFWPHNRLGGDRNQIAVENGVLDWGRGVVTATLTQGASVSTGVWTALNHPIRDHTPLDLAAIFPAQIAAQYQGRVTHLQIDLLGGAGTFFVELRAQDPDSPGQEISKWSQSVALSGGPQKLLFSLSPDLGEAQNLNWLVTGDAGDWVVVDRVAFTATLPLLETPARAFLWSYAMLLANWSPDSGLTHDLAYFAAGEFDNISASGVQAAAAAAAWRAGFISYSAAADIVSRTTQALLALPRCHGLWPHFVQQGQIVSGTEWSSIDTAIALVALIEARQALGLDTTPVETVLTSVDWSALILGNGSLSMGYETDCSQRLEDPDGGAAGGWRDFGAESWLINLAYAAATGQTAVMDHTPPTHNGSGFIDELAWLFAPAPSFDRWGAAWAAYRQQAADCQLNYYRCQGTGCLYCRQQSCYGDLGLFGLSAAEVPDLSAVPAAEVYCAFGVGGKIPPQDGAASLGHAAITPHYAALIASLRPGEATAAWHWLETNGLFTPLNNVESLMLTDEAHCGGVVWNALKGSWNLGLQTLGWSRLLTGGSNPLYEALLTNDVLWRGYVIMWQPAHRAFLPLVAR